MELLQQILAYLGGIVAIGATAAAAAFGMFRLFATKWIETRFSERLEAFRHRQNQEIEHLRFRINTHFDRMTKLHQHEFDILPQAWSLANDAYYKTLRIAGGFSQHPDLDRMGDGQFAEFVEVCRLNNWEKEELKKLNPPNRNRYYIAQIYWQDFNDARVAGGVFSEFIMKNTIFIEDILSDELFKLCDLITTAIIREQFESRGPRLRDGETTYEIITKGAKPLLAQIGTRIRTRLWTQENAEISPAADLAVRESTPGPIPPPGSTSDSIDRQPDPT